LRLSDARAKTLAARIKRLGSHGRAPAGFRHSIEGKLGYFLVGMARLAMYVLRHLKPLSA